VKKRTAEDKPRRLTLSRETIQILDEPALLTQAKGGLATITTSQTWTGYELNDSSGC
jgi:hypothetical protein